MIDMAFDKGAYHVVFVEEPPDNQIGEIIYPLAEARFLGFNAEYGDRLHLKKAYIPHAKGLSDMFSSLEEVEE
jgi:heterodisulfide reductase subunit A